MLSGQVDIQDIYYLLALEQEKNLESELGNIGTPVDDTQTFIDKIIIIIFNNFKLEIFIE